MCRPSAEVEQVSDTSNLRFEGVEDKIEFHLPSVMYDNGGIVQDLGLFPRSMSKFWLWQVSLKKFNPLIFPGGVQAEQMPEDSGKNVAYLWSKRASTIGDVFQFSQILKFRRVFR
jgi:hypothetical protein